MVSPIAVWRDRIKNSCLLGRAGKIISFSKINNPPKGFQGDSYYVAVVDFGGERKTGQLILEGKKPKIGAPVERVIRIIGQSGPEEVINYGVKFRLI